MVTVAIHQPEFLPWLGFFHKALYSNKFVLFDIVQYNKQDYQNRNKVMDHEAWHWIRVPIQKHKTRTLIRDILICNTEEWAQKIENQLYIYYRTKPYFQEIYNLLSPIWTIKWEKIVDLNVYMIRKIFEYLSLETEVYLASDIIQIKDDEFTLINASNKNLMICKELQADRYLSGINGKNYLDISEFRRCSIDVRYINYPSKENNPSVVDSLFNCGKTTRLLL